MPLSPASPERSGAHAAAVTQVLIARTRELLCEACTQAPATGHPITLSARVDGTDLFVITPAVTELRTVGPAQTAVIGLDGRVVGAAWDRRAPLSPDTAAHASAHRAETGGAVASCADRLAHASAPAAALLAVAEPVGPSPAHGTRPGSVTTLPAGKTSDPHHNRRSTQ